MVNIKEDNIRKQFRAGNTPMIVLPRNLAFKHGTYVKFERIDANTIQLKGVNIKVTDIGIEELTDIVLEEPTNIQR